MSQYWTVHIHRSAGKELENCSDLVQDEFRKMFRQLFNKGYLEYPYAKKMEGKKNLFEIRIRSSGQYRAFYSYIPERSQILILLAFRKKTNKTPQYLIRIALQRLRNYNLYAN